ncbi:hypothetical protein AK812_SmicGene42807 [Symbiodinium microadriaticum]|uniref:Uncharacterized protein n=1 Tax=Symbiodinium microadriaticum TaxID=2951 RepID=A0A1Q9C2M7_SYMMI|nr:hypothetical protein AK812_SmicGene42807 [Symbiodinium microadriaticum]
MIHIVVGCVKLPNKTPSRKFLPDLKANTIRRKGADYAEKYVQEMQINGRYNVEADLGAADQLAQRAAFTKQGGV